MSSFEDQILQGIVFITLEKGSKRPGNRTHLFKNIVSIRRRNEGVSHTNTIRFSPEMVEDLTPYDSVRLAKNTLTGDIYFVFFKEGKGDTFLRMERNHSGKSGHLVYPVISGKQIVNALLKEMNEPEGSASFRIKISDNLSHDDSFYTVMITGKI